MMRSPGLAMRTAFCNVRSGPCCPAVIISDWPRKRSSPVELSTWMSLPNAEPAIPPPIRQHQSTGVFKSRSTNRPAWQKSTVRRTGQMRTARPRRLFDANDKREGESSEQDGSRQRAESGNRRFLLRVRQIFGRIGKKLLAMLLACEKQTTSEVDRRDAVLAELLPVFHRPGIRGNGRLRRRPDRRTFGIPHGSGRRSRRSQTSKGGSCSGTRSWDRPSTPGQSDAMRPGSAPRTSDSICRGPRGTPPSLALGESDSPTFADRFVFLGARHRLFLIDERDRRNALQQQVGLFELGWFFDEGLFLRGVGEQIESIPVNGRLRRQAGLHRFLIHPCDDAPSRHDRRPGPRLLGEFLFAGVVCEKMDLAVECRLVFVGSEFGDPARMLSTS